MAVERADTRAPTSCPLGVAAFKLFVFSQPSISCDKILRLGQGLTKEKIRRFSDAQRPDSIDSRVSALSVYQILCYCSDYSFAFHNVIAATSGDLRLAGGGATYGRVEIFYNKEWGTICDNGWDDHEAAIVCRHLGFSGGLSKTGGSYGQGTGKVWLTGLGCGQYDADLLYCVHDSVKENEADPCGHERDAGVECNKGI